jgi:hypothetical protein
MGIVDDIHGLRTLDELDSRGDDNLKHKDSEISGYRMNGIGCHAADPWRWDL